MSTGSEKPLDIDIIGRYKVLKILGSGAMGVVYQAVDPVIERVVAIKTVHFQINQSDMAEYEARFAQEIKAAGKLNHPHIVTIFDVGKTDRFAYMAMEYIEGEELKALVGPGKPMPVAVASRIAAQVADGLAFAHSRDIIHRDVKPSNIMVAETEDGLVAKVMDFGIARMPASTVKTLTGMILGSPRYMSPEQVIGSDLTEVTDVFSLGVVLYEMLTGVVPFDGPNISAIMYATVNTPPPPPSAHNPLVPEKLDALVLQALSKEPTSRFATMREFARALHDAVRHIEAQEWPPVPEERRVKLAPKPTPAAKPEAATIRVKVDAASVPAPPAAPVASAPTAHSPIAASTPAVTQAATAPDPSATSRSLTLSGQFNSIAGTMRLAKYTQQTADIAPLVANQPEEIRAAADLPPTPPASQRPAISLDATAMFQRDGGQQGLIPAPPPLPTAPLALLGGLSALVVVLGIALIII